jgi:hypothetical protein
MGNESSKQVDGSDTNNKETVESNISESTAATATANNGLSNVPIETKEKLEQKLENQIEKWRNMSNTGVKGVCTALKEQLHIEAAHEGFEDWYDGEDQTLQPDVKIINKCIQVLIEMPTEASQYVKDKSTTKDMISFTEMFKHAINIVALFNERVERSDGKLEYNEGYRKEDRAILDPKRRRHVSDSGEEDMKLSKCIHDHANDASVPTARKIIRGCLRFLSEAGKLTTTDGTDKWYGMKDAIKQTKVVSIVTNFLHAHTTQNSFVFWGLNALYFCCRDGPNNDWENIEEMRNQGGMDLCTKLRSTCSEDPDMLVHIQLLHTMMTMKDDDDENLLDVSLATSAQRVIESGPGFGAKLSDSSI